MDSKMNAATPEKTQVLIEANVREKLRGLDGMIENCLRGVHFTVPTTPGRDVQILPLRDLPAKKGLSLKEGQARLVHDLASIELQAMELCLRTLIEFPLASGEFRLGLADIARDEGRHLKLCLDALDDLGFPWGSFPAHVMLWHSVAADDSLLDRIVIVHRYLEGSGLDATDTIFRRLSGVPAPEAKRAVEVISRDEVGHVKFGSHWYHRLLKSQGMQPEDDFGPRLARVISRIPRRIEPIAHAIRLQAGFLESEIAVLEKIRADWLDPARARVHS